MDCDVKDLGLVHAACLAIIERSALVTTAFTVVGKQILRVKEPFSRVPVGIITLKNRTISPLAQNFIASAREVSAQLMKEEA